jgi:hypothetical protein
MSEKDKGFSFRRLFIRETETETANEQKQIQKSEQVVSKSQEDYFSNAPQVRSGAQDQSLIDGFVQRLQNLINQNNQPGFDFLEFTESLFEEKQNPSPETYKTVFRVAQKIDKTLTPAKLLDSSMFYKDLVQRTADGEISKGNAKKQGLQTDKDNEKNNLDSGLKDTRAKIQQLTQQIQELRTQEMTLSNQLQAIDQKYDSKFSDIDKKVNAIRSAKEQVLVSIVDIEAGIKSNLT